MLLQALLFGSLVILGANSQYYSDLEALPDDPFSHNTWHWKPESPFWPQRRSDERDVEEVTEKDREPLGPNYEDPTKPKQPKKPTFNPSVIPGGVVDVDASGSGFPNTFPEIPDNFGFSSFGARYPGLFGLGGFFGNVEERKPWWRGPNICVDREESTDDDDDDDGEESKQNQTDTETDKVPNLFATAITLSNCFQTADKYECVTKVNNHGVVKTFTVRYKCCYGFKRTDTPAGCNKQVELKPLLDTIEEIEGKEFKTMIQSTGLEDKFAKENLTVFVPSDSALNEFTEKMLELNQVEFNMAERRRRDVGNAVSSRELVLNQVIPGFVQLSDFSNEQVLHSENNNSTIRFNIYPTRNYDKMVTANCARIRKADNLATNGIAHVTDGVIIPVRKTIQEIIRESAKLSNFRKVLENTNLEKNFKDNGHYTLFAPTDEAFDKLDESTKQKLLKGDACAGSILKHHVVAHTVCASAIIGNATTHSVDGELLNLERTSDNSLIIEDKAKITKADVIATNGVIHFIGTILIPDSALHISQAVKNENLTKFYNLIEDAGLLDEVDSLENTTVFAPSNEAFKQPEAEKLLESIKGNKEALRELIFYHTAKGKLESCDMHNNDLLKTYGGDGKPLRVNLYSTLPVFTNIINRATVNCARLIGFDERSCGSIIHEVDQVLIPPSQHILDLIDKDESFSILSKVIKGTEVEAILKTSNQSLTLLAPDDAAFAKLGDDVLKSLTDDKKKANDVLKSHILTEILCCGGVGPQTWGFNSVVPTLSGEHQQVGRSADERVHVGRATITKCDNVGTNGVVHTINKVLLPQRRQNPAFGGFFLFDF